MHLDHVTIRTRDIRATSTFFANVFDLTEGPRPRAIEGIPGVWMYNDTAPIVHIIGSRGGGYAPPAEAIDHVGLRLTGYEQFRKRLTELGVPYTQMDLDDIRERRLFLRAPGGPLLEAVFAQDEKEEAKK